METVTTPPQRTPGEILRDIRRVLAPEGTRALTQAALAKRMGYTEQYIQRIEKGRAPMQLHHVGLIAQLKVDPARAEIFARLIAELRAAIIQSDPHSANVGMIQPAEIPKLPAGAEELAAMRERLGGAEAELEAFGEVLARIATEVESLGGKVDAHAGTMEGKTDALAAQVDTQAGAVKEKVDALAERVGDVSDQLDRTDAKVDSTEATVNRAEKSVGGKLDSLIRVAWANFGIMVVGFAALFVLHCQHGPSTQPSGRPATNLTINLGPGGREGQVTDDEAGSTRGPDLRVEGSLGSRKIGPPMPHKGLPGQKGAPCHGSQEEHYDACWLATDKSPPCPPDQFQEGSKCYVPIQANPDVPIGGTQAPSPKAR